MEEKRQHPRAPYGAWVTILQGGQKLFCLAQDLSLGGIYLLTDSPLALQTAVQLQLLVEGDSDPIVIDGEVVRLGQPVGFGVRFSSMDEEAAGRLFELFKSIQQTP